ncbi:acyl-CoA dehydrogenase family protein [Parafrankia sp. EUN1f]|uniref:acyl-CoA dehydrogenase family protein n=1 Tax=Parafrankia sp. EUN1f TaxID=102897 RepID=UPI0001C442F3|nr:acyl-CoA dehydrogenase family protein [Parafrankia sp. EUN1f]EFC84555.1 acyl-CoA dehydrogenase domain protein [Parafrankia sp. EUN1f]
MDFADSAEEARFRVRLRAWLGENNPHLPASSTSDEYWEKQPEWHRSLYRAGFFGLSWPVRYGGHDRPTVYDVIVDEELAAAHAPPRPNLGYLVQAICAHANDDVKDRFLPDLISGRARWCQGFSEPDAGSDLASLRTRAVRDSDQFIVTGHKVWTSYSDVADWCLLLARTDPDARGHRGLSAFAIPMNQPGITQRPLKMISGVAREFGEVTFDAAVVPAVNMIGSSGDGWAVAMTVLAHEREPQELGNASRYRKTVKQLQKFLRDDPAGYDAEQFRQLAWAIVESDMLAHLVSRRLSERLDGLDHGVEGSIDKLLMTSVEQTVGHAAVDIAGATHDEVGASMLATYLYSRAQSVMGGTAQIQRNLIAHRVLGMPRS